MLSPCGSLLTKLPQETAKKREKEMTDESPENKANLFFYISHKIIIKFHKTLMIIIIIKKYAVNYTFTSLIYTLIYTLLYIFLQPLLIINTAA